MIKFHPKHLELHQEIHARPYPRITTPSIVSHIAWLHDENDVTAEYDAINELARIFQVNGIIEDSHGYFEDFGQFSLRWENHREFSTITIVRPVVNNPEMNKESLQESALDVLPGGWLNKFPGEAISATHLSICSETDGKKIEAYLGTRPIIATNLINNQVTIWTAMQMDSEGFTRFYLQEKKPGKFQLGRVVLKIVEIETYRQMALLSLPLAKKIAPQATLMGQSCARIIEKMTDVTEPEDESKLLQELTALAAEVERLRAASSYRFSATKAYAELVNSRIEELEQERITGKAIFGEFLQRRFMPAIRTCAAVRYQLEGLSKRLTRASDLLRTRVEQTIAEQNQKLLESMNRRSQLQLRLQQTVEGLSVAAISYYLIGLWKIILHGVNHVFIAFDENLVLALSVPVVIFSIFFLVRKMKKKLMKNES